MDVLTTTAAATSSAEAERLAHDHFGVSAIASPMTSERDQNFHLKARNGAEYILKITNPAEDGQVIRFQTQALQHIATVDPEFPVPRVLPTLRGEPLVALGEQRPRIVRLLSFLSGVPMGTVPRSPAQRRHLGRALARLDLAMRGFSHPASAHELAWDIKQASRLRPLLGHVPDAAGRALAASFLDRFEENALPIMPKLRAQVIHNDFQPYNVLVDADDHDTLTGVIDFGDLVHAPLVDDLAVACAYHLTDSPGPVDFAAELVAAYHALLPLQPEEIDILFDLIAVRLVITVAITGWRAARFPENREYILRNNPRSWSGLTRLAGLPRQAAQRVLRQACRME